MRRKEQQATFEARMIENFFMLMKDSKQEIQEDHTTQKINAKKHYTRHIHIQTAKKSDK